MSTVLELITAESADGWSLHAPGSSDEAIANGDAPALSDGPWPDDAHIIPKCGFEKAIKALEMRHRN